MVLIAARPAGADDGPNLEFFKFLADWTDSEGKVLDVEMFVDPPSQPPAEPEQGSGTRTEEPADAPH